MFNTNPTDVYKITPFKYPSISTTSNFFTKKIYRTSSLHSTGKSIFERTISWIFYDEIAKSTKLLYPYFSLNIKTALLCTMTGTCLFLGIMLPIQQHAFRTFIDIATKNPTALHSYLYPLLRVTSMQILVSIVHVINALSCKKLREDLSFEMHETIGSNWIETMAFIDPSKTKAGSQLVNPPNVLVEKIDSFCRDLISLINSRISALAHFAGALYSLYLTSGFFEISLLGFSIDVPSLILICFLYANIYNFFASWANTVVKKSIAERTAATDKLNKLSNNIHTHSKTIAFLGGEIFEKEALKIQNKKIHTIDQNSLLPQAGLSLSNKLHWELSVTVGAIAQLLKGDVNPVDTVNSGHNFSQIVKTTCFRNDNLEALKGLETRSLEIQKLLNAIDQYTALLNQCQVTYKYNNKNFIKINLKIPTKEGSKVFYIQASLEPKKIYRLIGPSGAGKTTFLEILKGKINPSLASGTLNMPLNNLFLPQIPHIIKGKEHSLMHTILYPNTTEATLDQIDLTNTLLTKLQFEKDIIDKLTTINEIDWDKSLSPGQKQKIAIISCILKKPDAIFLDEPFAAMDPTSRKTAIQLIYHHLPNAIILYIEHKRTEEDKNSSNNISNETINADIQLIEEPF